MLLESINAEQRPYVVRTGDTLICMGFANAERDIVRLAAWLGDASLMAHCCALGTSAHYDAWRAAWDAARAGPRRVCNAYLTPQLVGLEGMRVEVTDVITGPPRRFIVGKSTGWAPVHLEVHNRRSRGGAPRETATAE